MEGDKIPKIGSSNTSTKAFFTDLRVLVVDHDLQCLTTIETMLRTKQYEVVAVRSGIEALNLLWERKGRFDLVLISVDVPDINGLKLFDYIRRELRIPIIIMSIDDKVKIMRKYLENGACFYLVKPIMINDIQNLWQYVLRQKCDMQDIEHRRGVQKASPHENAMEKDSYNVSYFYKGNWIQQEQNGKMHKERDKQGAESKSISTSQKKKRMIWTSELHNQFLVAIHRLGFNRASPKKILMLMEVPGLTRENVTSHLQKYRLSLKRREEESRTMEPRPPNCLTNGSLTSSFPPSHPSLMSNSHNGNPQFLHQQWPQMPLQGNMGNIQGLTIANGTPSIGSTHFLNENASNNNFLSSQQYEQIFPMSNQEQHGVRMGPPSPPPPPPPLAEEDCDSFLDMVREVNKKCYRDLFSDEVDQATNEEYGVKALVDPNFDISAYELNDDDLAL